MLVADGGQELTRFPRGGGCDRTGVDNDKIRAFLVVFIDYLEPAAAESVAQQCAVRLIQPASQCNNRCCNGNHFSFLTSQMKNANLYLFSMTLSFFLSSRLKSDGRIPAPEILPVPVNWNERRNSASPL